MRHCSVCYLIRFPAHSYGSDNCARIPEDSSAVVSIKTTRDGVIAPGTRPGSACPGAPHGVLKRVSVFCCKGLTVVNKPRAPFAQNLCESVDELREQVHSSECDQQNCDQIGQRDEIGTVYVT